MILGTISTAVLFNILYNRVAVETSIVACIAEFPLCFHWKAKEFGKSVSSWPLRISDENNESCIDWLRGPCIIIFDVGGSSGGHKSDCELHRLFVFF